MTTSQMLSFITVAKFKSFTKAANALQFSVSALSRQITSIEEELQVPLIKRDSKHFELTECGIYFYKELQKTYNAYEGLVEETQKINNGYSGYLSFGILTDITLKGPLQKCFLFFTKKYPQIHLKLERCTAEDLINGIIYKKYDCVISPFYALNQYDFLKYKIIERHDEGILIAATHPMAKTTYFDPIEFRNQTYILVEGEKNSLLLEAPLEYFRKHNINPRTRYVPDPDSATLMVEAGLGISFSNSKSIGSHNPGLKFIPIKPNATMTNSPYLVAAWNEDYINPALDLWINVMNEKIKNIT